MRKSRLDDVIVEMGPIIEADDAEKAPNDEFHPSHVGSSHSSLAGDDREMHEKVVDSKRNMDNCDSSAADRCCDRRWAALTMLFVVACGVIAGVIAGAVVMSQREDAFREHVSSVCAVTAHAMEADIGAAVREISLLSALHLSPDGFVDSAAFDKMGVLSVAYLAAYLEIVHHDERAEIEAQLNRSITRINSSFLFEPSPERDRYAVVMEVVPGTLYDFLIGWDELQDVTRSVALIAATESGRPSSTVVYSPAEGFSVWAAVPLFENLVVPDTAAEREASIQGYVVGATPYDLVLNATVVRQQLSPRHWDLRVRNLGPNRTEEIEIFKMEGHGDIEYSDAATSDITTSGLNNDVTCSPTKAYRDDYIGVAHVRAGVIAACVTFLIALVLALLFSYQSCIRHEVKLRTAELQRVASANSALATQYLLAKKEAEAAIVSKEKLMAFVCHELRNPLHSVAAMNSFMVEDGALNDQQRLHVQTAQQAVELMLRIVNDMLLLSKIDAHKLHLETRPFLLRPLIEAVVKCHEMQASLAGISLSFRVGNDVPTAIRGDATRLCQVVTNLLSNAIKFTSVGGVSVTVVRCEPPNANLVETADRAFIKSIEAVPADYAPADHQEDGILAGTATTTAPPPSNGSVPASSPPAASSVALAQSPSVGTQPLLSTRAQSVSSALDGHANKHRSEWIAIEVRDTGIGIDPKAAKDLFSPYMQVHSSTITDTRSGTGLGLAIVASFVKLMNGVVTCDSVLGQGTKFTVMLPIEICDESEVQASDFSLTTLYPPAFAASLASAARDHDGKSDVQSMEQPGSAPVTQHNSPSVTMATADVLDIPASSLDDRLSEHKIDSAASRRLHVLLVEDNVMNRQIFMKMLRESNFDIETAENGMVGVEKVDKASAPFDIIFMDIMMPVMDGNEAARVLRSKGLTMPIIALTGNALSEDRDKALGSGMTDYLCKPFSRSALLAITTRYANGDGSAHPS